MAHYLGKSPEETGILLIDGHPLAAFDDMWPTLFQSCTRINELKGRHLFADFAFNIIGYASPISSKKNRGRRCSTNSPSTCCNVMDSRCP